MPRLLELFSGTGSVGRIFRARGWEVINIDSDPKTRPAIVADIGSFEYRMLGGAFDCVWCSLPCTQYSIARSYAKTERDLDGSDQLVRRCRDIISCFQPMAWFIENPHPGLLKGRDVVADLPSVVVDYCMYGWPYRKRTIIFTNTTGQRWTVLCNHDCEASDGKRHTNWAQKAGKAKRGFTRQELYAMPPLLCEEVYAATRCMLLNRIHAE